MYGNLLKRFSVTGRLDFKHKLIVNKYMLHFYSKVDKMNNDMCNSVLVILKELISSNVCVMIMVLLYIIVC